MEHLDFNDLGKYRTRDQVLNDLVDDGLPVAIYGAGQIGKEAAAILIDNGIKELCFIETPEYLFPGKKIEIAGRSIECITADEMIKRHESFNAVLAVIEDTLLPELKKKFSMAGHVDYFDVHASHRMEREFLTKNKAVIEEIYAALSDEESKDVFEAFLHARYTGDVTAISSLNHDEAYLYDWELLGLSENDVVIDAGAYTGDTIKEMSRFLNACPKKIYAFEPDEINIGEIRKNAGSDTVVPVCAGLYDHDDTLSFSGGGSIGSSISDDGALNVKVIALDSHDEYKDATIIKMDIEGSELAAIKGAKALILAGHPRMAICIYHNNEDVIVIYNELKELGYRFYMRQHSRSSEETVLYAV
ncbi:MAG: FkbM family methyltransferase [Lachnospiraceae bacterium]|nr:FkbM family methyltransferase [Lachnospiraceae bacterium]